MSRLIVAFTLGVLWAGHSHAQCPGWIPRYPPPVYVSPWAFWGTPPPAPLPPIAIVPKRKAGVQEEEPVKPAEKSRPKVEESKEKEPGRLKKVRPPIPDNPEKLDISPGKPAPKKEPRAGAGKAVEQYLIPAEGKTTDRPAEVKVGFFNHSDRDLVLEVDGEALKLPKEQYVTLRLKRTFTWAEKGKKPTDVAVPPDADGMEIVFRR